MHRIARVAFLLLAVIVLTSTLLVGTVSGARNPCGRQPPRGDACEPVF